ncbi:hypothetical protein DEU38_12310 [Rhodococcus sp. AG1013]|uniref:GPW/gp25 family protein n=1 Tax=Rhodococcus sp. AG1013 TaxID=2183996 RepID=UPI000E0BCF65|nr:GPW/gp25 family protein [Rhodococcus sp. AG1013]RDI17175.1 hypothetical protein DEU38_12310 [Rhodococcus sp. AG1013]
MSADFVGAGWSSPVQIDATGAFVLVTGATDVEQAIEIILRTAPGERPMRPEFGCRVHDHVFAPTTTATAAAIAHDVRSALEQWEPRIDVEHVYVDFDESDLGAFFVDIGYRIHGRNEARNLVFPFYVIPDEPPPGPTPEQGR